MNARECQAAADRGPADQQVSVPFETPARGAAPDAVAATVRVLQVVNE